MNSLNKTLKRAARAGGRKMPVASYAKVFGNSTALRKNVLRACERPAFAQAVEVGVVADHRVFEVLLKMGELAARLAMEMEVRRGKKMTRSRAIALSRAFCTPRMDSDEGSRVKLAA